jgi:hypothetical protein
VGRARPPYQHPKPFDSGPVSGAETTKIAGEGGYLILKHPKTTDVLGPTLLIDRRYWFSSLRFAAAGVHSLTFAAERSQLLSF